MNSLRGMMKQKSLGMKSLGNIAEPQAESPMAPMPKLGLLKKKAIKSTEVMPMAGLAKRLTGK